MTAASLARFSAADLTDILDQRRAFARDLREQFGRDHFHARAAVRAVRAVVVELEARGIAA